MKAEIIAVGTEILMGYIVNTNASWIGQELLDIGIGTYYQQVVGDNGGRMEEAIELAANRSDIVIVSGGLGPTRDDITKQVVADFLGKPLVIDAKQEDKVKEYYKRRDYDYGLLDANQAAIAEGSLAYFNDVGLACGYGGEFEKENGTKGLIIVVPGPPFELKPMFSNYVKPHLQEIFQEAENIESLYLNFYGRGETMLSKDLDDLIQDQTNPTIALYAQPNRVTLRLTASGKTSEETKQLNQTMADQIIDRAEDFFIGYGENFTLEDYVVNKLMEEGQSLTAAESLTGGLVMNSLAQISGASKVLYGGFVTYMTHSKVELLGVDTLTIQEYSVVSDPVVRQMAEKAREKADTDLSIALTGVAGPDSLDGHPAGEVYIALAIRGEETRTLHMNVPDKPRAVVQETAKYAALNLVREYFINK